MIKRLILLFPLLLSCYVYEHSEEETIEIPSSLYQKIEVKTINGRIEIEGIEDTLITVRAMKKICAGSQKDAEKHIKDIVVRVIEDREEGILRIEAFPPKTITRIYNVSFHITLPSNISSYLNTSNGGVSIKNMKKGSEIKTSNGAIEIHNHSGSVISRTSNGRIVVEMDVPIDGMCKLKTSNGGIMLSIPDTTSARIEAETSNGRIELRDLDISIEEVRGTYLKGKMGKGEGEINLKTSNGNIILSRIEPVLQK